MSATIAATSDSVDVPDPTENGRLPPDAIERIRRADVRLPLSLAGVVLAWCVYQVAMPVLWVRHGAWVLLLVPTVGISLFCWLGYYRHELWHNYFPRLHNPTWFNLTSYLLFSDPQVYRVAHPTHHKHVHTPDDLEFFCAGWRTDVRRRRLQFLLELLFGNMAWELTCLGRLKRDGRATSRAGRIALVKRLSIFLVLLALAGWIEPGARWPFVATFAMTVWAGSLMTRHNQWIEHLGIVSDGTLAERNLLTRNLPATGLAGRLFNLVNHDDPREHVFHHTEPRQNSRGVDGLTLPPGARTVTFGQYLHLLAGHHRALGTP